MLLLFSAAVLLLVALAVERVRLDRARDAIALRIAVTGTRGKTTVVRILASVLRENGQTVLAKTTGSEPCLILPDGTVERIRRRGPASLLEQKRLIHRAVRLGADAVVAEIMSIHAENHAVEGRGILVPHLVLATNFFVDHTDAQGDTPEAVGAVLALAVPRGATVLVPEGLCSRTFRGAVAATGATLVEVPAGTAVALASAQGPAAAPENPGVHPRNTGRSLPLIPENLDLVVAAARRLGVGDDTLRRGIAAARHDVGALGVWSVSAPGSDTFPPALLVNAFAANDPTSTARVHDEVMARFATEATRRVGLLCLRPDRGERTLQWADALAGGLVERFDTLLVTGLHATALARRVRKAQPSRPIRVLPRSTAEGMTRTLLAELGSSGGVVFGFGNIGGPGLELVEYWSHIGNAIGHGR